MEFKKLMTSRAYRLSDAECDEIKTQFAVNDARSDVLTAGGGCFWGQFWAHGTLDSMGAPDGKQVNRYTGFFDGGDGVYPRRQQGGAPVIDKTGRFSLPDGDLPIVNTGPNTQLTPDNHRGNENRILKAHHLAFAKSHNARMNVHGDYERAKTENLATWSRLFINETLHMCQADEKEMFSVAVPDFNLMAEANFAVLRVQHATAPDSVAGRDTFTPSLSGDVDLFSLYNGSEMARNLEMGISPGMSNMEHVGGETDIRERTISWHSKLELATYSELALKMRVKANPEINPDWPIWPALLKESELQADGFLGPVGRRAFMDAIACSITKKLRGENRWKGAPSATLDILDWALT